MEWIAALVIGAAAFGAAGVAYTLSANLEREPEFPAFMTDGMRVIGVLITVVGVVLGVVMLGYAVVAFLG